MPPSAILVGGGRRDGGLAIDNDADLEGWTDGPTDGRMDKQAAAAAAAANKQISAAGGG
jgi:hypothetical protein